MCICSPFPSASEFLIFKIKAPAVSLFLSPCSSESDAPATENRGPHWDVQLSEVGWRAGPDHIVTPSDWPRQAESQPLYWPAGVPPCASHSSLLLSFSPQHWPSPLLPLPLPSSPVFLPFHTCGGGIQPPTCRGCCGKPEAALSLRQLRVSSSSKRTDVLTGNKRISAPHSWTTEVCGY